MEATLQKIRNAVTDGGIQKQELATEAGLHRNSLAGVEFDGWDPRVSTVRKLSEAVDRIHARRTKAIQSAAA